RSRPRRSAPTRSWPSSAGGSPGATLPPGPYDNERGEHGGHGHALEAARQPAELLDVVAEAVADPVAGKHGAGSIEDGSQQIGDEELGVGDAHDPRQGAR